MNLTEGDLELADELRDIGVPDGKAVYERGLEGGTHKPCGRCGWSTYVPPEAEKLPGKPLCGNCAVITSWWETGAKEQYGDDSVPV